MTKLQNSEDEIDVITQAAIHAASQTGMFPPLKTSLFRYVSMRGDGAWPLLEKTVLKNVIPLTTSSNLNDPFDSNPIIVDDITIDEFIAFQKAVPSHPTTGRPFMPIGVTAHHPDGRIVTDAEKEQLIVRVVKESFTKRNKETKIASFCRRVSSQLLWSHYANGYKGLAYHFVTSSNPKSALRRVHPVQYERQRPILLISEMLDLLAKPTFGQLMQMHLSFDRRAYLTKSKEWSYEEEERLVYHQKSNSNDDEAPFEPSELAAIIIGPRFPDDDLTQLKSIVSKRSRPLKLFRARISESDYAIEVEWSNPV